MNICKERDLTVKEWKEVKDDFGKTFRQRRKAMNLSMRQVAEKAEMSVQGIFFVESDTFKPRRKNIRKLLLALDGYSRKVY